MARPFVLVHAQTTPLCNKVRSCISPSKPRFPLHFNAPFALLLFSISPSQSWKAVYDGVLNMASKLFRCKFPDCASTRFRTPGAQARHEREEHNGSNYKCEQCRFSAKRRYQLHQHVESDHGKPAGKSDCLMAIVIQNSNSLKHLTKTIYSKQPPRKSIKRVE